MMLASEPPRTRLAAAATSTAERASKTSDSASLSASSALRRSAALPEARWSFRKRWRNATCASAAASRARSSSSLSLINGSSTNTLSLALTSTSPTSAPTTEVILISPDNGSTRPGATACQSLSDPAGFSATCVSVRMIDVANAITMAKPTKPSTVATLALRCSIVRMVRDQLATLPMRGTFLLLADDAPIFEGNNSIGEWQETRIVRNDQHAARTIFGNLGKDHHDSATILTIQRRGWFIGKNSRRICDNCTRYRYALL